MFFTGYTLTTILGALIIFAGLLILNELTRKNKMLSIIIYIVFPIIMTLFVWPRLAAGGRELTWFAWIKTYSALAGVLIFMAIRFNEKLAKKKWMLFLPAAILIINIIEAIIAEFECAGMDGQVVSGLVMQGGIWSYLNAFAGIILILTMTGTFGIRVANTKSKDMVWADMGWPWIIAYDLWNISYCYNCISNRSFYAGFLLIASCTFAEFVFKRGAWLQHRAQTLALFAMFSLTVDYANLPLFQITSTQSDLPKTLLAAAALIANLAVMVYEIKKIKETGRNPIREDIYVDTKFYQKNLKANNLL
ncbi:MAG TPA: DUF5692 family protein [Candidatus Eisenbacteria bacterium]|nr:DUF5692 family protein [Candidatus Eisenbacteria bacterium]